MPKYRDTAIQGTWGIWVTKRMIISCKVATQKNLSQVTMLTNQQWWSGPLGLEWRLPKKDQSNRLVMIVASMMLVDNLVKCRVIESIHSYFWTDIS